MTINVPTFKSWYTRWKGTRGRTPRLPVGLLILILLAWARSYWRCDELVISCGRNRFGSRACTTISASKGVVEAIGITGPCPPNCGLAAYRSGPPDDLLFWWMEWCRSSRPLWLLVAQYDFGLFVPEHVSSGFPGNWRIVIPYWLPSVYLAYLLLRGVRGRAGKHGFAVEAV
jgi:hypothetical protein